MASDVIEDSILWIRCSRNIPALSDLSEEDKVRLIKLLEKRRVEGLAKYGKPLGYSVLENDKLINQSLDSFIYSYQTRDAVLINGTLTSLARVLRRTK